MERQSPRVAGVSEYSQGQETCRSTDECRGYTQRPSECDLVPRLRSVKPSDAGRETRLEYRRLGNSGLKVSIICLGAMMFGDRTPRPAAARIVGLAEDAGINFIDTADSYGGGASERVVGQLIGKRRERWVLATKVQNAMRAGDPNAGGLGRKWMIYEIGASLERLKTDYVDIYYLHRDDLGTPLAETVATMG